MLVSNDLCYEAVSDIAVKRQHSFIGSHDFIIIGSDMCSSYIKLPIRAEASIRLIVSLLDGSNSLEVIKDKVSLEYFGQIDTDALLSKLIEAGLIKGYQKVLDSEIDVLGVCLIKKDFVQPNGSQNHPPFIFKMLYRLFLHRYTPWLIAALALDLIALFFGIASTKLYYYTNINPAIYSMLIIALVILCFIIHETAHALSAVGNNISIKRFAFALYFGIVPMFFFSYYDLKSAPPHIKFKVVTAGLFSNFMLASISFSLTQLCQLPELIMFVLANFALLNLMMIVGNLFPFQLCDGYYVLSIILNRFDIRLSLIKLFFEQSRRTNIAAAQKRHLLIYCLIWLVTLCISLVSLLVAIIRMIQSGNHMFAIIMLCILAVSICVVVWRIIQLKRKKNVRSITS